VWHDRAGTAAGEADFLRASEASFRGYQSAAPLVAGDANRYAIGMTGKDRVSVHLNARIRKTFLPFSRPCLAEDEIREVTATLRSGWITTGPKVAEFEEAFHQAVGAPAALALNSGTAALHLGLIVSGVGQGDAVITTPLTFCSTMHVIEHVGARPILVDVEAGTLNIDPKRVEAAIAQEGGRGRVRAILPVHLYGHPCDMDAILTLAERHDLSVVEDAAHALPSRYKGRLIGSAPNPQSAIRNPRLTCFSFYATKNLTTGEGGMVTGDPALIDEARIWSLHGMSRDAWRRYASEGSWYCEVVQAGFKYNMSDIQAAIGLQQLRRLGEMQERRRKVFEGYDRAFAEIPSIERPVQRPGVSHAYHLYVIRLNLEMLTIDRAQFIEELRARNIGTGVHFIPNHLHPYYRDRYGFLAEDFPVAYREYKRLISLPVYPAMTDDDVQDVVEAVRDVATTYRW